MTADPAHVFRSKLVLPLMRNTDKSPPDPPDPPSCPVSAQRDATPSPRPLRRPARLEPLVSQTSPELDLADGVGLPGRHAVPLVGVVEGSRGLEDDVVAWFHVAPVLEERAEHVAVALVVGRRRADGWRVIAESVALPAPAAVHEP